MESAPQPVPQPNERDYEAKKAAHDAEVTLPAVVTTPLPSRTHTSFGS
jgi:hypothetical protein